MKIDARWIGPVAILSPHGRITIGETSEALKAALDGAIDGGAAHVVVEGSRVAYLDSSGIGELIAAARRLSETGGRMGIASPSPKLLEILELTKLELIFVVGTTEQSVLDRLPRPTQ